MGTRSLTIFFDSNGAEIVVMYRQYDGYPSGHGVELAQFLAGKRIVGGYTSEDAKVGNFNGMGCLAAQVIAHFKKGIGDFYLEPPGTRDVGEECIYEVRGQGKPVLRVLDPPATELFSGTPEEFLTKEWRR